MNKIKFITALIFGLNLNSLFAFEFALDDISMVQFDHWHVHTMQVYFKATDLDGFAANDIFSSDIMLRSAPEGWNAIERTLMVDFPDSNPGISYCSKPCLNDFQTIMLKQ